MSPIPPVDQQRKENGKNEAGKCSCNTDDAALRFEFLHRSHGSIDYLNRLGDLLFVLARTVNKQAHVKDDPWHPS